jgi:hypothetical protein
LRPGRKNGAPLGAEHKNGTEKEEEPDCQPILQNLTDTTRPKADDL